MASVEAFEIHTNKGGDWTMDSTYKNMDLAEMAARVMLDGSYFESVRIVHEVRDTGTGEKTVNIVFEERHNEEEIRKKEEAIKKTAPAPEPKTKQKGKSAPDPAKRFTRLALIFVALGTLMAIGGAVGIKVFNSFFDSL